MTAAKTPTVVEALAAVMGDVQGIRKGDTNTQQNYKFRGVDAVVNAVGPVLRKHNVVAVPISATCESEHYTTAKGTLMRGVTLTVGFRFYGPAGDYIDAQVCGEASDSGDKAVPKAHSVAYRTLLLQALCIPTDEPDPDSESHERGTASPKEKPQFSQPASVNDGKVTEAQKRKLADVTARLIDADKVSASQVAAACGKRLSSESTFDVLPSVFAGLSKVAAGELLDRLQRFEGNAA